MPRYAQPRDDRWVHPTYRKAYCFRYRNGMIYTSVNSVRKATGLLWTPKNRKLAMEILEQRIQDEIFQNRVRSGKDIKDLIERFFLDRVSKLAPATQIRYKRIFRYFFYENWSLDNIQEIRIKILERINSMTSYSPNYIRKMLADVKGIFNYAIELEWMDRNPITNSMLPIVKKKEVRAVTEAHIEKYKEYFKEIGKEHMALLIEFAYLTALRIQEIIDLSWDDVTDRYFIIKGKGSRDRIFPLKPFPRVKEILERLKTLGFDKPGVYRYQQLLQRHLKEANKKLAQQLPEMHFEMVTFHVIRKGAINRWRAIGIETEIRNMLSGHTQSIEKDYYLVVPDVYLLENRLSKI
ncbi:MAG: tyrosine-type recombinase/integrase [Ignavibacteria bacterium]|nr:tyrosine-type recombinase/integrase [Ignavibacteria bacterium]